MSDTTPKEAVFNISFLVIPSSLFEYNFYVDIGAGYHSEAPSVRRVRRDFVGLRGTTTVPDTSRKYRDSINNFINLGGHLRI